MKSRREFLKLSGVFAGSLAMAPLLQSKLNRKKPNILLILVDDLGYGDLSSYGAKDLKTPHIDSLMNRGMRFNQFYANCPVCSPTRASILTGRYPDLVGVPGVIRSYASGNFGYLDPKAVMLPSMLKKAGYHTSIIGKWHLGLEAPNRPNDRGFDLFHGFLGDMMDDYYTHLRHKKNYMRKNDEEIDPSGHATDLFTDWAIDVIKEQSKSETPFFMYLAYNAPHTPIQPPEDWLKKVQNREKGIDEKRAKLVALIEHLDDGIGKVIRALKASGEDENTLVIFTSDNGGQLNAGANNGPLSGGKQMMLEGGIRVPMCAVWPNHIQPETVSEQVALTMDLFPTICHVAGVEIAHEIEGLDIMPTLQGEKQDLSERMLFWVRREGFTYGGRVYYSARYKNYKMLHNNSFEEMKLYDLNADPREEHPLNIEHPMYQKLYNGIRKHIQKAGAVPWQKHSDK